MRAERRSSAGRLLQARAAAGIAFVFAWSLFGPGGRPALADDDPRAVLAKAACAAGDVSEGIRILVELYARTNHVNWVYNHGGRGASVHVQSGPDIFVASATV